MRSIVLALSLTACSEYTLMRPVGTEKAPPGTAPTTEPVTTDATCVGAAEAFQVDPDPTCVDEPVPGGFDPVVEWSWSENPIHRGYDQVMVTPVVADLDGDGFSDVVFTAFAGSAYLEAGALVAVSGRDGATLWSVTDAAGHRPYGAGGVAVGDLDRDGVVEVVVAATDGLLCVTAAGAFRWSAVGETHPFGYPALGDLDGDGRAEVVFGSRAVDADGRDTWSNPTHGGGQFASFAVDLDGDGRSEVVDGGRVFESDGALRFDRGTAGFTAVGDLDLDGVPEIVTTYPSAVDVTDLRGRMRWSFPIEDWGGGPPTIADFDGDGAPEIGIASKVHYRVLEADGTVAWTRDNEDLSSAMTGSSVFDFEGDGLADVVYADEQVLYVWDGRTGAEKLAWTEHSSGTLYEYPVIVDLDGDDSAEIVVAGNDFAFGSGRHGLTVLGDRASSWSDARAIWNQHAYYVTNVEDDGTIPVPDLNWLSMNHFRDNDPYPDVASGPLVDLASGEPVVCCDGGRAEVWVPVWNEGLAPATDAEVALRTSEGDTLAATSVSLPSGEGMRAGPFSVPVDALGDLLVVVGPSEAQCDLADDVTAVRLACP